MNYNNIPYSLQESINQWKNLSSSISELDSLITNKNLSTLLDIFSNSLQFGTAGLRGIMDIGFNRINEYTIKKASLGVFRFFSKTTKNPLKVVISFDTRNNSLLFAQNTAAIFLYHHCDVILFKEPTATPLLSYAVRYYNADVGIMITASHNPKEYNGYKVYYNTGGQILSEHAKGIVEEMQHIIELPDVSNINIKDVQIPEKEFYTSYYNSIGKYFSAPVKENKDLTIVYSPLFGTGKKPLEYLLSQKIGVNLIMVDEQSEFNGEFPTALFPNPEKIEVYNVSKTYALKHNADLIITSDPDADRIGVCVKSNPNEYTLLNGNEIGIIMAYYILSQKQYEKSQSYICSTIVSTMATSLLCKLYGVHYIETLTGFKYIAQIIDEHPSSDFLLGFEESQGYLIGDYIRDKDALSAGAFMVEIALFCKQKGLTLLEYLNEVYEKIGYFKSKTIQIETTGDVKTTLQKLFTFLNEKTDTIFDYKILQKYDFKNQTIYDITGKAPKNYFDFLEKTDLIIFYLEPSLKVAIRPSGTEPLIKVYLEINQKNNDEKNLRIKLSNFENKIRKNIIDLVK